MYQRLMENVLRDCHTPLNELPTSPEEEKKTSILQFNKN